jgi:hypothetical protein
MERREDTKLPKFPIRVYDRDQQYKTLAIDINTTASDICQIAGSFCWFFFLTVLIFAYSPG